MTGYGITEVPASTITGKIDLDRLPSGALERCIVVKDDAARFSLTTSAVQIGDTVKVTATGLMYFVIDDTKLNIADGYEPYTAGSASSVPWSGVTGKPTSFTPSPHTHDGVTQSVSGFMSSIDKVKLDGIASGANNYSHPTTSGNKHIPNGGSAGMILRWSADGIAVWGADNNTALEAITTEEIDSLMV